LVTFLEILERSQNGPLCTGKDWDVRIIPKKCMEKVKEYGIKYDPSTPVPSDNGLADAVFQAGFELALETGIFCLSTERIIKFEEEELREAVMEAPKEARIGRGIDEKVLKLRKMDERQPPLALVGPMGIDLSENLYIPIVQSVAQYRIVDQVINGFLNTVNGNEVRTGSPMELLAGRQRAAYMKEAVRRAGRTGVSITFGGVTMYGLCGMAQGVEQGDVCMIGIISELKTDHITLTKTAHALGMVFPIGAFGRPFIGGYTGGPEGSAIMSVAYRILDLPMFQSNIYANNDVFDIRYIGNSGWETAWANSVATQALDRNCPAMVSGLLEPCAGLCEEQLLYELAVPAIYYTASGAEAITGIRPSHGKYPNQASGLECKFASEVAKSSAGVKREDANEIVKRIIPKYSDKLLNPPRGKKFQECFDLKTLKPSEEWLNIYKKIRNDLEDIGVNIDQFTVE
jgi:methylamine--corrinoid protein Co-methyltransferase